MSTFAEAQYRANMSPEEIAEESKRDLLAAVESVMAMASREGISINKIQLNGPCYEINKVVTPYGMVWIEEVKA